MVGYCFMTRSVNKLHNMVSEGVPRELLCTPGCSPAHNGADAGFEFLIFLCLPLKGWDYRHKGPDTSGRTLCFIWSKMRCQLEQSHTGFDFCSKGSYSCCVMTKSRMGRRGSNETNKRTHPGMWTKETATVSGLTRSLNAYSHSLLRYFLELGAGVEEQRKDCRDGPGFKNTSYCDRGTRYSSQHPYGSSKRNQPGSVPSIYMAVHSYLQL